MTRRRWLLVLDVVGVLVMVVLAAVVDTYSRAGL
jgi:hypothetical protein